MNYVSLLPGALTPEDLAKSRPMTAFSEAAISFVQDLSAQLMRMPGMRAFPELTALAFWMRRANLKRLEAEMQSRQGDAMLVARGTVLHIAPSNVDTIFVYSWFLSLLSGNRNIVRLSSKPSAQADQLIQAISTVLSNSSHDEIARRTLLLRYAPDDRITERLSALCDVRVIWGGDSTVKHIRSLALPPTAIEVAFPNKYSLAIVNAQRWLEAAEITKNAAISDFYNDTYWFDQMACSSPRALFWVGDEAICKQASADFWPRMDVELDGRHTRFSDADYVNKLVASDSLAIESSVSIQSSRSNNLVRIWLEQPALHTAQHCGAGLFFESSLSDLSALHNLLDRTVQTISYSGFTRCEILDFIRARPLTGIDRFVPFGKALDFSSVWDGMDLLRTFTREISVL